MVSQTRSTSNSKQSLQVCNTDMAWLQDLLLRQACDRCHAQKLSCQRQGDDTCARCARASKPCTTSPSLRNKGRNLSGVESRQSKSVRVRRHQRAGSIASGSVSSQAPQIECTHHDGFPKPPAPNAGDQLMLPPLTVLLVSSLAGEPPTDLYTTPTWHTVQGGDGFPWTEPLGLPMTPSSQYTLSDTNKSSMAGAELLLGPVPALLDIDMSEVHHRLFFSPGKLVGETLELNTATDGVPSNTEQREGELGALDVIDKGWVSKLADLNVQLHTQTKRVAQRLKAKEPVATALTAHETVTKSDTSVFDHALGLLFQLLQILNNLPPVPQTHCRAGSEYEREEGPDHGSIYLILSCYMRVLRMCTDLLGVSRERTAAGLLSHEEVPLPSVSVGALALDAYPTLRLRVALEFLEAALDHLRAVLDPVVQSLERNSHGDGRASRLRGPPDPSQQGLRTQEDALYDLIKQIRTDLGKGGPSMFTQGSSWHRP